MFTKEQLTVGDWWLYWILMCIPIVNIIIFFNVLLSSSVNKTLKNHLLASILPFIIIIGALFMFGILGGIGQSI